MSLFGSLIGPKPALLSDDALDDYRRMQNMAGNSLRIPTSIIKNNQEGETTGHREKEALKLLRGRMRWGETGPIPFEHLTMHVRDDVAFVFIVTKDKKAITLEDDPSLFPSDKLITELRLLVG